MTLFAFRGAKSHEWTFCDPIKVESQNTLFPARLLAVDWSKGVCILEPVSQFRVLKSDDFAKSHQRAPRGAPKSMTGNVSH